MKRLAGLLAAVVMAAACGQVFVVPLDPETQAFYDTARLVMTGAEEDLFRRLPDTGARKEFIEDFWDKRDPDPETPENEFKDEFDRRVEYANTHYNEGKRGVNTDRGRVYLYLGAPEKLETYSSSSEGFRQLWLYYTYDVAVIFNENRVGGGYEIASVTGNLFDAFEDAKLNGFGRVQRAAQPRLQSFTASYDDARKEITIELPANKVSFSEESGVLKVEIGFVIYIYKPDGQKDKFDERRTFQGPASQVESAKTIPFVFSYDLPPGKNYVDIIISGGDPNGRARKIFTFQQK